MENGRISIWKRLGMELPTIQQRKRLRVSEINPHLICVLCGGYYIDATTITECLHTFCKTCIVGYLEASKHCPVCDNLVHKSKPHLRLRPDHTLQDLVYKLVPGLFKDEMNKRREFYKDEIQSGKVGEDGLPEERERIIYSQDEQISLVLELSSNGRPPVTPTVKPSKHQRLEPADRRYLQCPANITVGHLKKFLKMKFNLCDRFQIDFFHTDEILHDHYTLVDIAYIYSWRRKGPLGLYYTVFTNPAKRFKVDQEQDIIIEEAEMPIKEVDTSKSSERTETSGYLTDDEKDMDVNSSLESNLLPESSSNDSFELDSSSEPESVKLTTTDRVSNKTKPTTNQPGDSKPDKKVESEKVKVCDSELVLKNNENDSKDKESVMDKNVTETYKVSGSSDNVSKNEKSSKTHVHTDLNQTRDECVEKTEKHNQKSESSESAHKKNRTEQSEPVQSKIEVVKSGIKDTQIIESKCEPKCEPKCEQKKPVVEKPRTSEASTSTSTSTTCTNDPDKPEVTAMKEQRSKVKDDDVSEPVVSSTQNTQACQTEPPESHSSEKFDLPHSSGIEKPVSEKTNRKSKVDVSCETDNFVALRQVSVESVSVSTETEMDESDSSSNDRKKSVDCGTDVFDFQNSVSDNKRTVDCSTDQRDSQESARDNAKRKSLTVDCSTEINEDIDLNNKRKALTVDCSTDLVHIKRKSSDSIDQRHCNKKSEAKGIKRSNSHSAYSPKTSYMAQPLSPTKITLKFSATKSPASDSAEPVPLTKTQPQMTGFQSKYQSFVMELPEKTYDFNHEPEKRVHATLPAKTTESYKQTYMNAISTSSKKTQSKTGRPRGRPPKIKSPEQLDTHKEKKHKSRSHSPKHKKQHAAERHDKYSSNTNVQTTTSKQTSSSNAYTWINKVNPNTKQNAEKKQHKSKYAESSTDKPAGELKIPKQFLYFSNGQYTLATASSLATLKQSSPLSPTRTVWETQTSSYGDKHSISEIAKDKDKEKKADTKIEKSDSDKQTARNESATVASAIEPDRVQKSVNNNGNDEKYKTNVVEQKLESNKNNEVKVSHSVSSSSSERIVSRVSTSANDSSSRETISSTSEKFPEYRHQSPFFASYTRLGGHRPSTHLNIPNFTSHFNNSAHALYNHGRYTSDRLGIPIYRSMSLGDPKAVNVPIPNTKALEKQRLEAISSPCGFLTPYPSPYLGLSHLHSHLASSLPAPLTLKAYSPDSTKSQTSVQAGSSVSALNNMIQNKSAIKSGNMRKGKEKSIDNIISAITEMRTKKETTAHEQINGIDLSTKSSRHNAASLKTNNNDKMDRYAFPDDDEDSNRTSPKKGSV